MCAAYRVRITGNTGDAALVVCYIETIFIYIFFPAHFERLLKGAQLTQTGQ